MLKDRAIHRIEEGFRYLEVVMPLDQPGIASTGLAPEIEIAEIIACDDLYILEHFRGFCLVQVYALNGRAPNAMPVCIFEARFRCQRHILKVGEEGFKPIEYGAHEALNLIHRGDHNFMRHKEENPVATTLPPSAR